MARFDASGHTRREILQMAAAGATGLTLGGARLLAGAKPGKRKEPGLGLQLYSVRHACGQDKGKGLVKVLKAVKGFGYEAVEFAGYYGWQPKDLRKLLDDNGLKCCGTHTGLGALQGGNFQKTVDLHKTIGGNFIIVPGMPGQYTKDADGWKKAAEVFNQIAAKLKPLGMATGYHNHSHEFKKMGDSTPWEIFFDNTCADVIMQLDTGNCMGGKGDPVAMLKKYPGRARSLHLKEFGGDAKTVVGEGTCPWKQIIPLARTTAGTEWYVIEHERRGQDPVAAVGKCLTNLKKMLAET